MRVSASIGEPFVLSTYGVSQRSLKSSTTSKQKEGLASLYATHGKASNSSDGYATVTVQSEGVHVLDISTLHPVTSHTLGPSTTFSCPAITRNTLQETDSICSTYAAIESSPEINQEERGRTIWTWKEILSNQLEGRGSQKRKSVVISHRISGLHACHDLPTRILARSPAGDVTILDADLASKGTWAASQDSQKTLGTFVFSRTSCSFVPSQLTPSKAAIFVVAEAMGESIRVRILSVDDLDNILELSSSSVPLKSDDIVDMSCSHNGYTSFLCRDGTWHSYLLESNNDNSVELSFLSEPISLAGLSFLSKPQNSEEVSIVSLSSSHVLLSALTISPNPEIVLLLWDLQYSVLLASQALPIPATLAEANDITIQLTLVPASDSHTLLLLSPHSSALSKKSQTLSSSRSSVLVIPLACPITSTIANAMGRASASAKWVKQSPAPSNHDPQSKILATLRAAMERKQPQAADAAFFEWEKKESHKATPTSGEDPPAGNNDQPTASQPTLGYGFVKDLLEIALQPSRPANTPYSSKIVQYLLDRRLVSTGMPEGGLLACLRTRNDWQSITLALTNVVDLSEAEIMECLRSVVFTHRLNRLPAAAQRDVMEVDTVSDIPSLPSFLASCITYKTTPSVLRDAIHKNLKEAEDLHEILVILKGWIFQWRKRKIKLWPNKKDTYKTEHGIPVIKKDMEIRYSDLPPLSHVLDFTQTLLDTSFLTLLQYPPSHPVLRAIHAELEPQVSYIDELEQLRGPLNPFAQVQSKVLRGITPIQPSDQKRRRKQAREYADANVGLYRLEELLL